MVLEDKVKESEKISKKGYAYTPGLKIKEYTKVIKERMLPIEGDILVNVGDTVLYDTIVGKTKMPGDPIFINCSKILGVEPGEIFHFIIKKENDVVKKNEVLAKYEALFGLIKKSVYSPIDGKIESISELTGQIIVRGEPKPLNLNAYICGKVTEVKPFEGVVIDSMASFIQGIFGIGRENHGKIKVLVKSNNEILTANLISEEEKGCIIVGGLDVTFEALKRACDIGVSGIVVGGIEYSSITKLLGRQIGVTITGQEDIPIAPVITEGFGKMAMSLKTFNLFKKFEEHIACINGATQIRAGVIRPEIIITHNEEIKVSSELKVSNGLVPGTLVRIIAEPHFGEIGKVTLLPLNLQQIETESYVRILHVELEDGETVKVPRANVEILEE